jgi:hypothetical protein
VEECDRDIAALDAQRKRARSEEHRHVIDADILHAKKLRAMIVDKMDNDRSASSTSRAI